jgi:quinol-cytochrome oxidoreductase complex cytochrome b subunit
MAEHELNFEMPHWHVWVVRLKPHSPWPNQRRRQRNDNVRNIFVVCMFYIMARVNMVYTFLQKSHADAIQSVQAIMDVMPGSWIIRGILSLLEPLVDAVADFEQLYIHLFRVFCARYPPQESQGS